MRYIGRTLLIAFWVFVGAFLHYTLPQKDIVRVTGTEIIRKDFSGLSRLFYAQADSGDTDVGNRDLRLITTTRANGRVSVYRNEDTGFGWPPYFKLDSSNLQAEAAEVVSTKADPQWVIVTHYGWRSPLLSIYANAISLKPVDGSDAPKGIPWINIIALTLLTLLAAFFYAIWARWRRFRRARIDPRIEELQDNWEAAGDAVQERRGRFRRWLNTWR
ncbi:DUF1523 family protein [uncultured Tateyamaria sp.]|uniref:DUF1523 family protein n=1 Tax=uncultured Tateyamaria sp. TaxID=455651 RepID=UPI002621A04A|nr:DUF1523 family protein [uncultured Tateyamaria sp.]